MKKEIRFMCAILSTLMLAGCAGINTPAAESMQSQTEKQTAVRPASAPQTDEKTREALAEIAKLGTSPDDNYRTWYEIFVYSYCDYDGDGIGDLKGVTSKLDELQKLGVTGIWLMPIHPSTSYHKYNVSDYYAIDPVYGTMEDFDELIAQCDARGIRVILDLVLNHTGSAHPWFREATEYLRSLTDGEQPNPENCKYVDYYNFLQKESCPSGYREVKGTRNWFYEAHFSEDMPDLNLGNEALREDLQDIMKFWFDRGVSGFRLDAAKEYYSGSTEKNQEVLSWIENTARSIKPDCYLVAEVWDSFGVIADYYKSGITSIFDYAFGNNNGKITKVIRGAGNASMVSTYATALQKADTAYRKNNPDYIDAPFLSNHDVGRIAGFAGRDPAKTKLAGAMNLFMSGSAFIYYGEEIGMVCGAANDPSYRAPMYWNDARDKGTTSPPEGCVLPEEYPMGSLEAQKTDDLSVYNYYRQAVAIRNALPVIARGIPTAEPQLNKGCVSACRKTWNDQECIILMNIDEKEADVDLAAYEGWTMAVSLSADGNAVSMNHLQLHLPAYGTAILVPES